MITRESDLKLKWSQSNTKLHKEGILSFNLPAGITCKFAGDQCRKICYAQRGRFVFPVVRAAHMANYLALKSAGTVNAMFELLAGDLEYLTRRYEFTRPHAAGDYFNKTYLKAWLKVFDEFADTRFYSYSKALPLFADIALPGNFTLIQSHGGKRDDLINLAKPNARIFYSLDDMAAAGYVNCGKSDLLALKTINVGLPYH